MSANYNQNQQSADPVNNYAGGDAGLDPNISNQDNNSGDADVRDIDLGYNFDGVVDDDQNNNNPGGDVQQNNNQADGGVQQTPGSTQHIQLTAEQRKTIALEKSLEQALAEKKTLMEIMAGNNKTSNQQNTATKTREENDQNLRNQMTQFELPEDMSKMTAKQLHDALNATARNTLVVGGSQITEAMRRIAPVLQDLQDEIHRLKAGGAGGQDTVALDNIIKEHGLVGNNKYKTAKILLNASKANGQGGKPRGQKPNGGRYRNANKPDIYGDYSGGGGGGGNRTTHTPRNVSNMSARDKEKAQGDAILKKLGLT